MTLLDIDVDIKPTFKTVARAITGDLKRVNQLFVKNLLDEVELTQIQGYTLNSMPDPPSKAGAKKRGKGGRFVKADRVFSTYRRTFDLRRSSRRQINSVTNFGVEAKWHTELDYAPFVLGTKSQQAKIHEGRWKSTEEVSAAVEKKTDAIYEESFRKSKV